MSPNPDATVTRRVPRTLYAGHVKRWISVILVAGASPLVALLLTVLVILNAIQLGSPRRVLYSQIRVGRGGRRFTIYKLRTLDDRDGEPRVTRLGRRLRRHHLDELPQLWNILRGDMCLIGPRPEMLAVEQWARGVVRDFERRLVVRPGLTGLAQVRQGPVPMTADAYEEKLRWNDEYLASISFVTDVRILVETAWCVLRPRSEGLPFAIPAKPTGEPLDGDPGAAATEFVGLVPGIGEPET